MIAKNKSGWILHGYVNISEDEISNYTDVTGAYAIIRIKGKRPLENFMKKHIKKSKNWISKDFLRFLILMED